MIYVRTPSAEERQELKRMTRQGLAGCHSERR